MGLGLSRGHQSFRGHDSITYCTNNASLSWSAIVTPTSTKTTTIASFYSISCHCCSTASTIGCTPTICLAANRCNFYLQRSVSLPAKLQLHLPQIKVTAQIQLHRLLVPTTAAQINCPTMTMMPLPKSMFPHWMIKLCSIN